MPVLGTLKGKTVNADFWVPLNEVESEALDQVRNVCSLPWVAKVSIMPDVHAGKGCCVGSVIGMKGAVSASLVGVDIGCGMAALKTNLKASDLPDNLALIRAQVERDIPVGFNTHSAVSNDVLGLDIWKDFKNLDTHVQSRLDKALSQVGTLGGGNHFIELCLDQDQNVWMMLHSGSRNIGKELAEIHISKAKELEHNVGIVDRELATFLAGTPEFKAYKHDLEWAQKYALYNRSHMLNLYTAALRRFFPQLQVLETIQCHHNYVATESLSSGEELIVTRKGAIAAHQGQMGIIPGSMGACSFIVRGLGNQESICSASHGAGRRMSRSKAKKTFTLDDVKEQTLGVECKKDASVIDEIPGAYKDVRKVLAYQTDLVEIIAELKQVLCVKG